MPRKGRREIISVGDIGDTIELDTHQNLTGATTALILIDSRSSAGVWSEVAALTATVTDTANGIIEAQVSTDIFTASGPHEARAHITFSDSTVKIGDRFQFFVERGRLGP